MKLLKVAIDAFGGDNAPFEIIKGAAMAQKEYGVDVILVGDENKINEVILNNSIVFSNLEIVHADSVFDMHYEPTSIVKEHSDTSLAVALKLLAEDKADAFISAGSTGAIVVGGTLIVKRIKGVKRPAFSSMIPSPGKPYMLLDMGANSECRPEMLRQFAVMAKVYLENVEQRSNPKIALLNIGTEDTKGGELQKETYKLLSETDLNFIGNIEAREMPKGVCDAVVTDGFTGNIVLKLIEGTSLTLFKMIKNILTKNIFNKIAAAVLKKDLYSLKKTMDSSEVGGALLLGVRKPVIKAHGNSDAYAIKNAINQAQKICEGKVIEKISEGIKAIADE